MLDTMLPSYWLAKKIVEAVTATESDGSATDIERTYADTQSVRQKIELMQAAARAAQEHALAERIKFAEEVEIEEFYEASGGGDLGLKGDAKSQTAAFGAFGRGQKVTRRVVKLKGWPTGQAPSKAELQKLEQAVVEMEEALPKSG